MKLSVFHSSLSSWALLAATAILAMGCGGARDLSEIRGKVTFQGEPLKFGSVMFQPPTGRPAIARIQSDGTFVLMTPTEGDGAPVGLNRVRVTCFEAQAPTAVDRGEEGSFGKSLIPEKYNRYDTSGITVDVKPSGNEPVEINLVDE